MHTSMRSKYTGIKDEFQKAIENSLTMHLCGFQSAQLSSSHRCTPNLPLPRSLLTCLHYFSRSMSFLEFVWSGRVWYGLVCCGFNNNARYVFLPQNVADASVYVLCRNKPKQCNAMQLIRSLPTHLYH